MSVGLMPEGPPASRFAYVTLATNADYALGALALVNSIKATGTGGAHGTLPRARRAGVETAGANHSHINVE